ncbi:MAG: hypothetical protein AAF231_00005, partial [Pseudomonadota bacterium]
MSTPCHVLIGFAEALPAPEVVFSLLSAGHRVSVFARSRDLPLGALPLAGLHVIVGPEADAKASAAALVGLMTGADAPDFVLPLDDVGLWLTGEAGIDPARIAGASGMQAAAALDKTVQVEAARAAGLALPETVVVRVPGDLDQVLPLPVIAKPALAVRVEGGTLGKGDATYLRDTAQQQALKATLETDMEPLLVQPLVAGQGEGVFGFVTRTGVVGWSGHTRVRMMNPHGSGSSACRAVMPDADLRARVTAFLNALNWRGAFMVELLRDADGTAWFMEINGRMWGSLALARRQGLEYPAWAVAQAQDASFEPNVPENAPNPGVVRNLGREILHLAFVLRGPKSEFHRKGWPRFMQSV